MKIDFLERPDRPGVKICGFRSRKNAEACVEAGADAIGLNFFPKSKRCLDPSEASWAPLLRGRATVVGLFVNAPVDEILHHHAAGLFSVAQLHGDEGPKACRRLIDAGVPVIKAVGVHCEEALRDLDAFETPYLLLDAYLPLTYGGGGEAFDWKLARKAVERYPEHRILLAGGLTPDNVGEAVEAVGPAGVDAASGVESEPGVKDIDRVRRFVVAASGEQAHR